VSGIASVSILCSYSNAPSAVMFRLADLRGRRHPSLSSVPLLHFSRFCLSVLRVPSETLASVSADLL